MVLVRLSYLLGKAVFINLVEGKLNPRAGLFKAGFRWPRVSGKFEFRFERLKSKFSSIFLSASWWLDALKNNRGNYPRKCFWTKEKETRKLASHITQTFLCNVHANLYCSEFTTTKSSSREKCNHLPISSWRATASTPCWDNLCLFFGSYTVIWCISKYWYRRVYCIQDLHFSGFYKLLHHEKVQEKYFTYINSLQTGSLMKPSGLNLSCDLSKATIFTAHLSCLCKLKEKMEKQRY